MSDEQKPQMTEKELNSLREIHININWRGFKKAWMKMFHDAPFSAYQNTARAVEGVSRKMMTGSGSLLGMPVGIVLRNTCRSMYNSSEGRYMNTSRAVGVIGAIAAVGFGAVAGAPLVAGVIGAATMGFIGTWASYLVAGLVSAAVLPIPAYTTATLTSSTLVGAAVAAFSLVVAAPVNLLVAYRRSRAAMKGMKLTEDQMEAIATEFDKDSPTVRYQREAYDSVRYGLQNITDSQRKEIYTSLKEEFDAAAAQQVQAQAAAAPASKLQGPGQP